MTEIRPAPSTAPGDAELLRRYRDGDVDAFMAIYARYRRALYAYAMTLVRDAALAEDVLQDAFVRLMDGATPQSGSLQAYLYSIVRNRAIDLARRDRVRRDAAVAAPEIHFDDRAEVSDLLAQLPDEQREVVVLKVFGGLTLAEVADVTGVNAATATSRYRYAIEKLARRLEERHEP